MADTVVPITNRRGLDEKWHDNGDGTYSSTVFVGGGATSGTEYTEGDVDATIAGGAILWEDTGDTLRAVSAAKPLPVSITGTGTVTVTGAVDTELPAAAALADATANPTTVSAGSLVHGYNGTTWDRLRTAVGAATNAVATTPILGVSSLLSDASLNWQIQRTASAVLDGVAGGAMGSNANWVFNGSTFDRLRTASGDALAATGLLAAGNMVWNGATWDRLVEPSSSGAAITNVGVASVSQQLYGGGTSYAPIRSATIIADANAGASFPPSGGMVFNGTNWDRMRGTTLGAFAQGSAAAGTAIASAGNPVMVGGSDSASSVILPLPSNTTDATANAVNRLNSWAYPYAFNGATWDRQRNNTDVTLLASASRTTIQTSATITTYNASGITVWMNTTVIGTSSNTLSVVEVDPVSGATFTLLASAAIVGNGLTRLHIYPGVTAAANLSAAIKIPRSIQIIVAVANANASTYSVGYGLLV